MGKFERERKIKKTTPGELLPGQIGSLELLYYRDDVEMRCRPDMADTKKMQVL
jgi:hypothetical protein